MYPLLSKNRGGESTGNGINRIDLLFRRLKGDGKKALVPFLTAGDPDLAATRDLVLALEESGAHMIELGVPFSDPLADGPVIQASSLRGLRQGIDLKQIIVLVHELRQRTDIPIVLMTYFNPVYRMGLEEAALQASLAGVDGLVIPDLPFEESTEWRASARPNNLDAIFLVAPNTPRARAKLIAGKTSGFLYAVSVSGVTGKRQEIPEGLTEYLTMLRSVTNKPLLVGFGITSPSHVSRIGPLCDGVIVGSALIDLISRYKNRKDTYTRMKSFINALAEALREGYHAGKPS
jgi:tryptophan synthase alpha chain